MRSPLQNNLIYQDCAEYGKLKLTGYHRDHLPAFALFDSASVGVNFFEFFIKIFVLADNKGGAVD